MVEKSMFLGKTKKNNKMKIKVILARFLLVRVEVNLLLKWILKKCVCNPDNYLRGMVLQS